MFLHEREGFGIYTFPDGNIHCGQWELDKRHGPGTHLFKGGEKYTAEWHHDVKNGQGKNIWCLPFVLVLNSFYLSV